MDQRELKLHIDALDKAARAKEPSSNIISLLERIKKEVVPTEKLLRETGAGRKIAQQKNNPDPAVAKLAAEIVQQWRKAIEANKSKTSKPNGPTPKAATATSSPSSSQTATPMSSMTYSGDPKTRKHNTEKPPVNIAVTGTQKRDNCVGMIYNGLAFDSREPSNAVLAKAILVEKAAEEKLGHTQPTYATKLRSLFLNLKANKTLGPRVLSGEITATQFINMTDDELKSNERREEDARLEKDNLKNSVVPTPEKSISDALQCGRCKQKKVSYSQAQTRSADEPMTTFCECTVCGNRWKFS